ncbi:DAK2 domain-containing protein [Evtepia sp.]|uniref:DAK2 domain-containing protein n=1 Tax=Evtepia sp. TaxID=2773933 RepID=UPI002E75BF75|nr:DAK2 domain-containing protein [Evtepia sp.]MEE0257421.1 DAK2 domain-containing protein [Evtepia sp.]MEE1367476.1 DAK2 domain-containing protein [Evtepia sp.]
MVQSVDGKTLAGMLIHASACLNAEKQKINELNVFPVPDGDTGTNMSLTISTAAAELRQKKPTTVEKAAAVCASAMLRGARGNSGVILSLIFRGFSRAMKDKTEMNGIDLADALNAGVIAAYKAVMKPAEGTVLTVSRLAGERAGRAAEENSAFEYVLESSIERAREALADTINQNPVLKKAGVVDAGGMGFVVILQGMLDELRGVAAPSEDEADKPAQDKADFGSLADEEITFTYDTVFIVRRTGGKPLDEYRAWLETMGDSLVIGEGDEEFKVHVHTDEPGVVLTKAAEFGTLELAKIENMRTQRDELAAGKQAQSTDDLEAVEAELEDMEHQSAAPEKKYGFVAVAAGEGLAKVFYDLGVDGVISGGQTMNPSTEDILKQIQKTPAEIVYVLPNNKNIIMAAQQCVDLVEDKKVIVLPAKTVPQGISAMIAVNPDGDEAENTAAMEEAMSLVTTMEVTYAARDSEFDGQAIHAGDYLLLVDNQLFGTEKDLHTALDKLAQASKERAGEFISIFYGEGVDPDQAEQALALFQTACPDAEITMLEGGQPVYHYLISVE